MIQKLLLSIQMVWFKFVKILKNIIQLKIKNIAFDDMIPDMLSNKKLNPVVTELFIRGKKLFHILILVFQKILTSTQ